MRIGLFAPRLAQADATGIGRYVRELVAALACAVGPGEQLVVAASPEPDAPDWLPVGVERYVVNWPRRPVHAAWWLGGGPLIERTMGHLDVAHLLYPFPPIRSRAPQITTLHDLMPFEHPEWFPRSEPTVYRRSVALTMRRSCVIVVPSQYVACRVSALLDADPARLAVVPLGTTGTFIPGESPPDVESTCAQFGVEPGRFAVCIGAVSTRKNQIAVVRALAELGDAGVPLLIIGPDGHGAADTDAEIARLADSVRVSRTGFISDGEAAALVRGAEVLVHPSLEEGFGIVPLEAMVAGTPVIAAGVTSVPEVVGDAAVLVEHPTDAHAWADALREVIGSSERRRALVAAGVLRASEFTWESAATAMLQIYRDIAAAGSR
jgi:glycosyltransferase involved in cell wall biosynthesis